MEVKITCDQIGSKELKQYLDIAQPASNREVDFQIRQPAFRMRSIDPAVLIAVISTAGSSLTALLTSIFSLAKEKQLGKVVIESKDGTKIELPADYPLEKLDAIIEKLRKAEAPQILIAK